jgi:hypothetical protein
MAQALPRSPKRGIAARISVTPRILLPMLLPFTPHPGTLRPFWLAAALALAAAMILNLDIANLAIGNFASRHALYHLFAAAFSGALAGHLWARHRPRAQAIAPLLAAAAGMLITVLCGQNHVARLDAVAGILLLATIAPYCGTRPAPDALWRFWLRLAVALAVGMAAILVCGGSASLWLFSLKQLFDLDIPGELYIHLWASAAIGAGPLFALSVLARAEPASRDGEANARPGTAPRAVLLLLHYAVIPSTLAYAAMLHLYALKIAVSGQLPHGEIGWLVLAFGLAGTAAYLGGFPWGDTGPRVVRVFFKRWFALCIVPAALLAVALARRIADYGVTPPRYYLGLYALWLGGTAAFMLLRRNGKDPRGMVAAMGALLILSNVGPWNSVAVSARSQAAQLRDVLAQSCGMPGASPLPYAARACVPPPGPARERAYSALLALKDLQALDTLPPMFEEAGRAAAAVTGDSLEAALDTDASTPPRDDTRPADAPGPGQAPPLSDCPCP